MDYNSGYRNRLFQRPHPLITAGGISLLQLYERTATLHMKFKQLSTTKVSAIFQEPDDTKRDGMIDMLTEDEAKMLCKFLFEILPRRGEQKVRIKTVS